MSYQIGAYILTVIPCLLILYVDYCGEGSEKDTKEFFCGSGAQRTGKLLGWCGIRFVSQKTKVD